MNYISTRGTGAVSSAEAILTGLAPDGGLFVPSEIPKISFTEIESLKNADYIERAKYILRKYLTDFTDDELNQVAVGAYGNGNFAHADVAPVVKLSTDACGEAGFNEGPGNIPAAGSANPLNGLQYILELWHGPTCAFKDMALQILPRFLTCSMKKMGEKRTVAILVATSGDTGKAALEGFKDVDGTKILVFYPSDGVSDIQKLQMITQDGENVMVSAIRGNFDDAQNGVKRIFTSDEIVQNLEEKGYMLSSANSINWGRLVPQIVYYVSAYCDMLKMGEITCGDEVNVCVPTGNFGNILAAYYAKMMGIPIKKLICASNENNVLTEFINTGKYDRNREFFTTISPSMDILISSNLERLLYSLSDTDTVNTLMKDLSDVGNYRLDCNMQAKISELLWAGSANDIETGEQIAKTFEEFNYLADTHTAVALNVYEQYVAKTGDKTKTIIASTASPFKFGDSVMSALGITIKDKDDFEKLEMLSEISGLAIPQSLAELKGKDKKYNNIGEVTEMDDVVYEFLN